MLRRDTRFALAWAALLPLFILAPTVYATFAAPEGMRFTGSLEFFYYDSNTYLAWMRQGTEGWWLFQDRYTTETTGRCFFHPLFLLLGRLVRWTDWPVLWVWLGARLVSAFGAVFCLFLFVRRAVGGGRRSVVALLVVTLAGGLGWLRFVSPGFMSADTWMPELTFYQSLRWPFLWSIALMIMVGYFVCAYQALAEKSRRATILAGLLFGAVAFVHPYHVVTFAVVPGVFLAVEAIRERRVDWAAARNYVTIGLLAAPPVLYQLAVVRLDPVLHEHSLTKTVSPPLRFYLLGFGPVLLAFALAGARATWRSGAFGRLTVVWAVTGSLLLYAPIDFNRRLVTGLMIPIGICAAFALDEVLASLLARAAPNGGGRWRFVAAAALLALTLAALAPVNVLATREDWKSARSDGYPVYLWRDLAGALDWLRDAPDGVVLCNLPMGNLVPAFAGKTVYLGHWAQTVGINEKLVEVESFFDGSLDPEGVERLLVNSRARYVVFTSIELNESNDFERLGEVRFESPSIVVVEVVRRGS